MFILVSKENELVWAAAEQIEETNNEYLVKPVNVAINKKSVDKFKVEELPNVSENVLITEYGYSEETGFYELSKGKPDPEQQYIEQIQVEYREQLAQEVSEIDYAQ